MTLIDEIKKIKSTKKDLRSFGIVMGVFFALIGGFLWWKGKGHPIVFASLSAFFFFFGLLLPNALRSLQKVWMTLALVMGWVMAHVILTVLFITTVIPISLIAKLSGKKFLAPASASSTSYWISRKEKEFKKEDYERQF
jgi:hypothetical protein